MTTHKNIFAELNQINVSAHIEKKGQFSYLSWPWAVQQLRLADPSATWEVVKYDGLPFCQTNNGCFVEVAVTVQGVRLSQIHPVLDSRNKTIPVPSAFDINTSIQRCLVKAIALHGLGLYIYAGEDLPPDPEEEGRVEFIANALKKIKADNLISRQYESWIALKEFFKDEEEEVNTWKMLDSKTRADIKRHGQDLQKPTDKEPSLAEIIIGDSDYDPRN